MLARFERLVESALEGSLRRVFPAQLQPVQLAKTAARSMEDAQVVGIHGVEVPNHYTLLVAPSDLDRFQQYLPRLVREVAEYLVDYAQDRGFLPVGQPTVEIAADDHVWSGTVRGEARFVDLPPDRQARLDQALEGTRALRLPSSAFGSADASPDGGALLDPFGGRHPLDPRNGIVRIGRSPDNDLVLASQGVSRYHAQLRWERGGWVLYDLGSTNGSRVDGQLAAGPLPVADGAHVRLGDFDLQYRRGSADRSA